MPAKALNAQPRKGTMEMPGLEEAAVSQCYTYSQMRGVVGLTGLACEPVQQPTGSFVNLWESSKRDP